MLGHRTDRTGSPLLILRFALRDHVFASAICFYPPFGSPAVTGRRPEWNPLGRCGRHRFVKPDIQYPQCPALPEHVKVTSTESRGYRNANRFHGSPPSRGARIRFAFMNRGARCDLSGWVKPLFRICRRATSCDLLGEHFHNRNGRQSGVDPCLSPEREGIIQKTGIRPEIRTPENF